MLACYVVWVLQVMNAGDGAGEHPSQALLDLYTIRAELGGALQPRAQQGCHVRWCASSLRVHGPSI